VSLQVKPGAEANCRVSERQSCELPTALSPASAYGRAEAKWEANIRDLSAGGARIILRRRFEPGTALAIELPGDGDSYTVLARVVHVKAHEGGWSLGCQFVSALSDSEQERLLAYGARELEAAAVNHVRFRLLAGHTDSLSFRVKEFKHRGVWPLNEGAPLDLKGKGPDGRAWKLTVRVLECAHRDGAWEVICEMLKPPVASRVLAALGEPE
jgi:hypothetical protein